MQYRIEPLDSQTWLIEEYDENTSVYMYLLAGEKSAVLVDTGMGMIPLDQIVKSLTDLPVSVILTHGHIDHIGGTGYFDTVYMNPLDQECYRYHCGEELRAIFGNEPLVPVQTELLPITDGQRFDLGGRSLVVVSTPGHTVGSICLLDEERKWLFTGDTCCKAHVLLQMDYAAPLTEFLASIRRLLAMRETYTITWPGHHGRPVPVEIIEQFETAAQGLLDGTLQGEETVLPMGKFYLLNYQDIGIEYSNN